MKVYHLSYPTEPVYLRTILFLTGRWSSEEYSKAMFVNGVAMYSVLGEHTKIIEHTRSHLLRSDMDEEEVVL